MIVCMNEVNYNSIHILGALLVKNSSAALLKKTYFGGGTVAASSATERFHVFRPNLAER